MTAEVVNLSERRPHNAGEARCLNCKHEWAAVAPVGATWLECPECSLPRGTFKFPFAPEGAFFECACGNDLFTIHPRGVFCPNCGAWKAPWEAATS